MKSKLFPSAWLEGLLKTFDSGGLNEAKLSKALENMLLWRGHERLE